jgi:hypothetical protein
VSLASEQKTQRRRVLGVLAMLFFAPLAISFYLYYGANGWRPSGSASHGVLISPARPLPEVSLRTPEGAATDARFLKGKWSLIYIGDGRCNSGCRQTLYQIRQLRLSLNQDMERVQRVFLYSGPCCEQPFFGTEHVGLIAVDVDAENGRKLLEVFPGGDAAVLQAGRIYLSDPLGNLLMSYPPGSELKGIRADLQRLLTLSHIG